MPSINSKEYVLIPVSRLVKPTCTQCVRFNDMSGLFNPQCTEGEWDCKFNQNSELPNFVWAEKMAAITTALEGIPYDRDIAHATGVVE